MKGKRLFLQWALFMSLMVCGGVIAGALGWVKYLRDDPTHITLVTLGVFCMASVWCGHLAWKLSRGGDHAVVRDDLEHGWFASSLCVSIGLVGTAIGYYLMLRDGNAGGEAREVIARTFANTSIAIVNTVFGAVCGVIVEIQSHFIGAAVRKAARGSGKPEGGAS